MGTFRCTVVEGPVCWHKELRLVEDDIVSGSIGSQGMATEDHQGWWSDEGSNGQDEMGSLNEEWVSDGTADEEADRRDRKP